MWRFLRDCKVFNSRVTIAQFNRIYLAGKKNSFNLSVREKEVQRLGELSLISHSRVEAPVRSLVGETEGPSAIMDEVIHIADETEGEAVFSSEKWLASDDEVIELLESHE